MPDSRFLLSFPSHMKEGFMREEKANQGSRLALVKEYTQPSLT